LYIISLKKHMTLCHPKPEASNEDGTIFEISKNKKIVPSFTKGVTLDPKIPKSVPKYD
jgi:hypothetical protein